MFKEEKQRLGSLGKETPNFFLVPKNWGFKNRRSWKSIKLRIFTIFFKKLRVQLTVFEVLYVRYGYNRFLPLGKSKKHKK
jgi:hypothetical protein